MSEIKRDNRLSQAFVHFVIDRASLSTDHRIPLLSSKLRTQRENISLVQYQSNSFGSSEWFQMKSQQVFFFVVLLLPLIGMHNACSPS